MHTISPQERKKKKYLKVCSWRGGNERIGQLARGEYLFIFYFNITLLRFFCQFCNDSSQMFVCANPICSLRLGFEHSRFTRPHPSMVILAKK